MRVLHITMIALVAAVLSFAGDAFAQAKTQGKATVAPASPNAEATVDVSGTKYKKKTVYDFDDDVVEGDLQRPDGELVAIKRKAKHSSLIKIREHFIPEMLKSAEDL